MALEKLKSAYGATNKLGEKGTGSTYTPVVNGASRLTGTKSGFQTPEKLGAIPKGPDVFGGPEAIPGMKGKHK
tara:strand:+ start:337 stop:555 length:219 start_codon:yes stop_codon:yes gene_type:complete